MTKSAEIPYFFETPVPKYFRENGWFECEHMFKYIHWAFSRCRTVPHKVVKQGREFTLQPYEFISGRLSSPKECFLTENVFRNQQLKLQKAGILKKSTNSLTNHYTCYIWATEVFCKNNNQQNNQPLTNRQPTVNHKVRIKNNRTKEDHLPYPSSFLDRSNQDSKIEEDEDSFPTSEKQSRKVQVQEKIHVYENVYLNQSEIDECLLSRKCDLQELQKVVHQLKYCWPNRKYAITDWVKEIKAWKLQIDRKNLSEENKELSLKLNDYFGEDSRYYHQAKTGAWYCRLGSHKEQEGVIFDCKGYAQATSVFLSIKDFEFRDKLSKIMQEKGIK